MEKDDLYDLKDFLNWLAANVGLSRPGHYHVSVEQVVRAYEISCREGGHGFKFLDMMQMGPNGSPTMYPDQVMSDEDEEIAQKILDRETGWEDIYHNIPESLVPALDQSRRLKAREATYSWQRKEASRYTAKPSVRKRILDRDGNRCLSCGSTGSLTIDHVVPVTKGGNNSDGNLQALCRSCNSSKGGR